MRNTIEKCVSVVLQNYEEKLPRCGWNAFGCANSGSKIPGRTRFVFDDSTCNSFRILNTFNYSYHKSNKYDSLRIVEHIQVSQHVLDRNFAKNR